MLAAEDAIQALQKAGFNRDDISLIARDAAREAPGGVDDTASAGAGAEAGAIIGGIAGLAAGLAALAIPGIGPVLAAGPLALALGSLGLGAAAGGLIGALTGMNIPESDAHYYTEGIRRGGALVLVRTDDKNAERARAVLDTQGARDPDARAPQMTPNGARVYVGADDPLRGD